MQASEKLGGTGWAALALVLLGILVALTAGFAATLYLALALTVVVFVVLIGFCRA
ncbi:MAG: hypothetical protein KDE35_12370 [Geminicoccaceae bacterium]|nr:hypothetical protein [Geminicoccaceae bacterium]